MPNFNQNSFNFKEFSVNQELCAMKVGTDGVLLGSWIDCKNARRILDIGTGTGLLALMIAQKCREAMIDAMDIDDKSYQQAKENFMISPWNNRLRVFHTSIQEFAKQSMEQYDLIITNPPFFVNSQKSLQEERNRARHFDQTLTMHELIESVDLLLSKDGKFCLILPVKEGEVFIRYCEEMGFSINEIVRVKTKENKNVKRLLLAFSRQKKEIKSSSMLIHNMDGGYTDAYIKLTEPFYTHLPAIR
jgi:tRNA1Val (adenine37-N6)-methyltransferase